MEAMLEYKSILFLMEAYGGYVGLFVMLQF